MNLLGNTDAFVTAMLRADILIQQKLITLRNKFVALRGGGGGRAEGASTPASTRLLLITPWAGMVLCAKASESGKVGLGYKGGRSLGQLGRRLVVGLTSET